MLFDETLHLRSPIFVLSTNYVEIRVINNFDHSNQARVRPDFHCPNNLKILHQRLAVFVPGEIQKFNIKEMIKEFKNAFSKILKLWKKSVIECIIKTMEKTEKVDWFWKWTIIID